MKSEFLDSFEKSGVGAVGAPFPHGTSAYAEEQQYPLDRVTQLPALEPSH